MKITDESNCMPCPKCGDRGRVKDTRMSSFQGERCVIRRRVCPACGWAWSTKEVPVEVLSVLVADQRRWHMLAGALRGAIGDLEEEERGASD